MDVDKSAKNNAVVMYRGLEKTATNREIQSLDTSPLYPDPQFHRLAQESFPSFKLQGQLVSAHRQRWFNIPYLAGLVSQTRIVA